MAFSFMDALTAAAGLAATAASGGNPIVGAATAAALSGGKTALQGGDISDVATSAAMSGAMGGVGAGVGELGGALGSEVGGELGSQVGKAAAPMVMNAGIGALRGQSPEQIAQGAAMGAASKGIGALMPDMNTNSGWAAGGSVYRRGYDGGGDVEGGLDAGDRGGFDAGMGALESGGGGFGGGSEPAAFHAGDMADPPVIPAVTPATQIPAPAMIPQAKTPIQIHPLARPGTFNADNSAFGYSGQQFLPTGYAEGGRVGMAYGGSLDDYSYVDANTPSYEPDFSGSSYAPTETYTDTSYLMSPLNSTPVAPPGAAPATLTPPERVALALTPGGGKPLGPTDVPPLRSEKVPEETSTISKALAEKPAKEEDWFDRNKKWAVPAGLGGLLGIGAIGSMIKTGKKVPERKSKAQLYADNPENMGRPSTMVAPPRGYRPGIDPEWQYIRYADGGRVGMAEGSNTNAFAPKRRRALAPGMGTTRFLPPTDTESLSRINPAEFLGRSPPPVMNIIPKGWEFPTDWNTTHTSDEPYPILGPVRPRPIYEPPALAQEGKTMGRRRPENYPETPPYYPRPFTGRGEERGFRTPDVQEFLLPPDEALPPNQHELKHWALRSMHDEAEKRQLERLRREHPEAVRNSRQMTDAESLSRINPEDVMGRDTEPQPGVTPGYASSVYGSGYTEAGHNVAGGYNFEPFPPDYGPPFEGQGRGRSDRPFEGKGEGREAPPKPDRPFTGRGEDRGAVAPRPQSQSRSRAPVARQPSITTDELNNMSLMLSRMRGQPAEQRTEYRADQAPAALRTYYGLATGGGIGGLAGGKSVGQMGAQERGIEGRRVMDDAEQALSNNHPDPETAIGRFRQYYGEDALATLMEKARKGNGLNDAIPATIDGSQEAALSSGEFVIPADVVSHLGNGSSHAGTRELDLMLARVRKARTGSPKQAGGIHALSALPG